MNSKPRQILHTLKMGVIQRVLCTQSASDARKLTQNITLRLSGTRESEDFKRPLVLLFAWLGAKAKHIEKYQDFYLGKGFDVASIKVSYNDMLRPKLAQKIAEDVLSFTTEHNPQSSVLAHSFSVGCYMFSEALVKINSNIEYYEKVGKRLKGQIFDSPVDFHCVPKGVANVLTDKWLLNRSLELGISSYMSATSHWVTRHYQKASDAAKQNALKIPTLFLYSQADPICFPHLIEEIMNNYRNLNIDVMGKCWPDSTHVSHFHKYPEEYKKHVNEFLVKSKLALADSV